MAPESFWENLRRFFSEIKSLKEEEKLLEKSVSQKTGSPQVKKRVEDLIFAILELKDGNLAIKILNYFLENPRIFLPESEFFKLFPEGKLAILHLLRFGILEKKFIAGEKEQGYSLSRETFNEVSIFKEIIREYRLLELIKLSSVEAKEEFKIILAKEGAFHQKVKEILDQNLESIINFGKNLKFEE
ncbi:hypothetical protein H5T58_01615, partial [Candidatus Parcubacteria bacterium]|nr:hypothetical protein [Candidatus Parcubacteria bacterium]